MRNIGSTNGNRIFNMETMNVDTLRQTGAIDALVTNLQTNNVAIARIQETHNDRNGHMERGYTIFFSG